MYKIKYYLWCLFPLLIFLPLLAIAHFLFGAFYSVYNVILFFLIISSAHNLLNKHVMIQSMIIVDIATGILANVVVFLLSQLQILLYSSTIPRGILILVALNQLFMYTRNNYKERIAVRKGIY